MRNYNYDSIVKSTEAEALKDMIFKRARERAEMLNKDTQNSYTSAIQDDVMELAHNSFAASKNPFAPKVTAEEKAKQPLSYRNIGFSERKVSNLKNNIQQNNATHKTQAENGEISSVMNDAGRDFTTKKSFTGALDFLNSQASITLVNKGKHKFEAVA